MRCPHCHAFPYHVFRIRLFGGVGLKQYLRGYTRCAQCGTLLKVLGYDRSFWLIFPGFLLLTVLGMIGLDQILDHHSTFVWIFLPAALVVGFGIGLIVSRYTRVEKADPGSDV